MKSIIKSAKTIEEAVQLGLQELGLKREDVEVEVIAEPTKGFLGIFGGNDATVKVKEKEKMKINIDDIFSDTKSNYEPIESIVEEEKEEKIDNKFNELIEEDEEIEEEIIEIQEEIIEETIIKEEVFEDEIDGSKEDYFDTPEANSMEENISKDLKFVNSVEIVQDGDDLESVAEKTKKNLENLLKKMHIDAKVSYETENDNIINLRLTDISENDTGIVIGSKGETLNAIQYILSLITNSNIEQFYRVTLDVADYRERRKKSIEQNAQKVAFKVLKTKRSIALKPMNSYERRIVHYSLQNYKGIETVSTGKFPNRKVIIKYEDQ